VSSPNLETNRDHYRGWENALTLAERIEHQFPRPRRTDLELLVELRSRSGVEPGIVKNVCEGGVFVATPHLLTIGDWAIVSFAIPGATEPIEILGEVRWSRPFQDLVDIPSGMGLRFVETPLRAMVLALELRRMGETGA